MKSSLYLLDYPFGGARYNVEIAATTWDDAQARLDAIKAWGRIEGEIHDKIPAPQGLGWAARIWVEILIWFRGKLDALRAAKRKRP